MSLTELEQWELTLRKALDRADVLLEERYAERLTKLASRPERGTAASPKYDGVFSIQATFTMGYTTGNVPGYVIEIRVASSPPPSPSLRAEIQQAAAEVLPAVLAEAFPGRALNLTWRKDRFFLSGDLGFSR